MNAQALVGPLIGLGVLGAAFVRVMLRVPLVPQSFTADTVMALVVNALLKLTVIVVSLAPKPFGWLTTVVPAWLVQI
jgi:hypothetical protein